MKEPLLPKSIEDFGFPITLAFSKSRKVYLSERMTGRLWKIDNEDHRVIHTFNVVPIIGHHETGLLGIALDPDFEENSYIYCYYTTGTSKKDFKNRVVRIKDNGTDEEIILDNIPAGTIHNGGILTFGPDKTLYIGTGADDPVKDEAQDLKTLNGKILRINRDGSIPIDNPFSNSPIYSYGHRNIFGLAFHPKTNKLYACDVGPDKNDEINIIEKGRNYGWPIVTGKTDNKNFVNPIKTYTPVITPVQCTFVLDNFYFGSFNEGTVHKITFEEGDYEKIEKDEIVYRGDPDSVVGVFYGTDDLFYVTTKDKIIRFEPKVESPIDKVPGAKTLKQGMTYPIEMIKGRVEKTEKSIKSLKANEGAIVDIEGEKIAAYKTPENELITLSPVCTHMGCIVDWNNLDKTWDCPCHGSVYLPNGKVKNGPADKDLQVVSTKK